MFKIFTKIKQGSCFSFNLISFVSIFEMTQIIIAIDIIFPIKNEFNIYLPFYIFSPFLYLELLKKSQSDESNDLLKSYNSLLKNNTNVISYFSNRFLKKNLVFDNYYSEYENYLIFIVFSIFALVILAFCYLLFLNEKDSKNSTMKNKYFIFLNGFTIFTIYIFFKPFSASIILVLSNFLIPFLFFKSTSTFFDFMNLAVLCIFIVYLILGYLFLHYLLIAYANKTSQELSFDTYEKIKFLNKILICCLIQFQYFESIHFIFFKLLVFLGIIYLNISYMRLFARGIQNNFADFLFNNFTLTMSVVRILDLIGSNINKDFISNQTFSYQVFLFCLNFVLFLSLSLKISQLKDQKLSEDLFNNINEIPFNLAQILSDYIENIISTSNTNIYLNNFDLDKIIKSIKNHKAQCLMANFKKNTGNNINDSMTNSQCGFCSKVSFTKLKIVSSNKLPSEKDVSLLQQNNNNVITNNSLTTKEILKNILSFLDKTEKLLLNNEEKDFLILCKLILIYIIDDFKIHRLSYFIIKNLKISSFKFSLLLNFVYEKLIIRNMRDDDANFILLNYVELNEYFSKAIKLCLEFNEELRTKAKTIKKIISNNLEFGKLQNKIYKNLKSLQSNLKNIDKSNFYKFLWSYNLIYNKDYENDILLDTAENIDLIDIESISVFKFSFFLLNYHFDTNIWTFKKVPFIFIKNFGFTNKEMIGKNFDTIFPPLIKSFEREKMEYLFRESSNSRFTIDTYLISKKQHVKRVDLTFDILPALYENSFIISNIINYDIDRKDNIILVNKNGYICYTSEIPHMFLGISFRLISNHKELVSIQNLFKMNKTGQSIDIPQKIEMDLNEYYVNYTNIYIYEPTIKDNIEELDIKEFYDFYQKAKVFFSGNDKTNKIKINLELVEERYQFYIYRCLLTDNLEDKQRKNDNHNGNLNNELLKYFIDEKSVKEEINSMLNFESTYKTNNKTSSDSSGREYFSSSNRIKNQKDQKFVEMISKIIWLFNAVIALLGLVFIIYIKYVSSDVLNVYEIIKDIRIINSNYIDCMTHIVQMIVLGKSKAFDSLEKKAKVLNTNITLNFSDYLREEFKKKSNKVFIDQTKTYTDFLKYISIEFLNQNVDTQTANLNMQGDIVDLPFLDIYKQFSNLAFQISTKREYYYDIPFLNITNAASISQGFEIGNDLDKAIYSLMYNYRYISEKFANLDRVMSSYFETLYSNFENKVYLLFVVIIIVHLISIMFSFLELIIFHKKLLGVLKTLLQIRKKELNYINFKLKSAQNLVDLEDKPSEIIENLKYEKTKIKNELLYRNRDENMNYKHASNNNTKNNNIKNTKMNLNYINNPNKITNSNSSDKKALIDNNFNLSESKHQLDDQKKQNILTKYFNEKDKKMLGSIPEANINTENHHDYHETRKGANKIASYELNNNTPLVINQLLDKEIHQEEIRKKASESTFNSKSDKFPRETYDEKNKRNQRNLVKEKNRGDKANLNLKRNKKFYFNSFYNTIKLLFNVVMSYLLFSACVFVVIKDGFGNISISGEYIRHIVEIERLSVNYLVNLKLAIAFNDSNLIDSQKNEFELDPKNLYISYNRIDNIINNYRNMIQVKNYIDQLKDKNLCSVVLKNDMYITNNTIISNICDFCLTNIIFSSNDKIIISYFIQNMRNLYVSYATSNKSSNSISSIYNSETSQLINFIFLFFIRPFIRTTKEDLGFSIYLGNLNSMVYNCFILFGFISLLDIINFLIMKKKISNRVSTMFINLKNIVISMSME